MIVRPEEIIRPFLGVTEVQNLLDPIELVIDDESIPSAPHVAQVDTYLADEAEIFLRINDSKQDVRGALRVANVRFENVQLSVWASALSYAHSQLIYQSGLNAFAKASVIPLKCEKTSRIFEDSRGFDLRAWLTLRNDQEQVPLRPHRAGTWLAKREFSVRHPNMGQKFTPVALTQQTRSAMGLPPGTRSYVRIDVDSLASCTDLHEAVVHYVDERVLRLLSVDTDDLAARQLQLQLLTELLMEVMTVAEILHSSGRWTLAGGDTVPPLLLARLVAQLATAAAIPEGHLLQLARSEPTRLKAHIEDCIGLLDATRLTLN